MMNSEKNTEISDKLSSDEKSIDKASINKGLINKKQTVAAKDNNVTDDTVKAEAQDKGPSTHADGPTLKEDKNAEDSAVEITDQDSVEIVDKENSVQKDANKTNDESISATIKQLLPAKQYEISDYMKQTVHESQILVSYIARYSPINVDENAARVLIESNYLIKENIWGPELELRFWNAYDEVASSIEPVTIESLKATMLDPFEKKTETKKIWQKIWNKKQTDAARSVTRYRFTTALALILLLLAQIYWINGSDLTLKLENLFIQIDETTVSIEKRKHDKKFENIENDLEINALQDKRKKLIQEFGAAYQLLQGWNRIWQIATFKEQFKAEVTHFVEQQYKKDMENIKKERAEIQTALKSMKSQPAINNIKEETSGMQTALNNKEPQLDINHIKEEKLAKLQNLKIEEKKRTFEHEFDKERNKLFLTRISAEFVIRSLQVYALPLLYGLLGAIIYTLRQLASEIRDLTYTSHSETKYRLRITLGLLGGMAIGWFLKPEDLSLAGSLSPMALAFLVGYNVEILFSVMDKFIDAISKFNPEKQPQTAN